MSDIVELLRLAHECENKWGRDRGNGWLLRHPLTKLLRFQQFCLTNPAFLKSRCGLAEYCEAVKTMEGEAGEDSESSKTKDSKVSKPKVADTKQKKRSGANNRRSRPKRKRG